MVGILARRLAALIVLVLAACTGEAGVANDGATATPTPQQTVEATPSATESPTDTAEPSATAEPSPTEAGDAEMTVNWVVPFTLTAPADWGRGETTRTAVEIVDDSGLRVVLAAFLKSPDSPDAWVQRLTTNEAIDASEPEPIEVGGASGHVFDARLTDAAPACAGGGSAVGGKCFVIHGPEDGWLWGIEEGRPARIWVLDVDGETVLMFSDARDDRFDAWVSTIDEVVSSIRWGQP